jgi:hypothetical protein
VLKIEYAIPLLYVGSGTAKIGGVKARLSEYDYTSLALDGILLSLLLSSSLTTRDRGIRLFVGASTSTGAPQAKGTIAITCEPVVLNEGLV